MPQTKNTYVLRLISASTLNQVEKNQDIILFLVTKSSIAHQHLHYITLCQIFLLLSSSRKSFGLLLIKIFMHSVYCYLYNIQFIITHYHYILYISISYFSLYPLHSESSAYGRYAIALTTTRPLLHNTNNVPNGVAQKALWLCFFVVLLP